MLDDDGIAIERTDGARRVDGLLQPARCMVKTSDSAFHDTALAELLRDGDVDRLVLAGVSTESCNAATATQTYAHDLRVVLVKDATASVEWRLHDETLERLDKQYRQQVVSADDLGCD
jgi:nicotinamidase-related amidase